MDYNTYLAHIGRNDDRKQSLHKHLHNVRQLCEKWGSEAGLAHVCGLAGWLHDAGKYSQKFQTYIRQAHAHNPNAKRGSVDHATAGAIYLAHYRNPSTQEEAILRELVGNVIMAHHNPKGALDYLSPNLETPFSARLKKVDRDSKYDEQYHEVWPQFFSEFSADEFDHYYHEALTELADIMDDLIANQNFYLRFILSVLIDADHTDTADFENKVDSSHTSQANQLLSDYFDVNEEKVRQQIEDNQQVENPRTKQLDELRQNMSDECYRSASDSAGIYTLSVPTGGGKTLSSLRFALRKAKLRQANRIVYIVPYTTIIEQNADAIRERLNGNPKDSTNILEYHSAVSQEPADHKKYYDPAYYYARDSWDAPIILTSQVAYLDALFGSGSKNIRHMHRLIHSVLIFDEIQTLPLKCIRMNNHALEWLTRLKTTSLLCTATQPALDKLQHGLTIKREIVPNLRKTQSAFKRVDIKPVLNKGNQLKTLSLKMLIDFVADQIKKQDSILIILNTKAAVLAAYQAFPEQKHLFKYHLSTSMCTKHRQDKFEAIRKKLQSIPNTHEKVLVFSTNLIEAGVDLSFSCVIRSCAGLDSIIQAAGRCNRNHEVAMGNTYVIEMEKNVEHLGGPLEFIQTAAGLTKSLLTDSSSQELLSYENVTTYFTRLYERNNSKLIYPIPTPSSVDSLALFPLIASEEGQPNITMNHQYQTKFGSITPTMLTVAPNTVARYFQVIDSHTTDVIVQYDDTSKQLVTDLLSAKSQFGDISQLLKQVQPYCVSVYGDLTQRYSQLAQLVENGSVHYHPDQEIYVADTGSYDKDYGLGESKFTPPFL